MSERVFPSFPGLSWSVQRKPRWNTTVKTSVSGREYRNARWSYPVWEYSLSYEVLRDTPALTEAQQLAGFFNLVNGSYDTWLYDDPDDRAVSNQTFGVGDGVTRQFQLLRTRGGFTEPIQRVNSLDVLLFNGQPANLVRNNSFEFKDGANQPYGYVQYNNGAISTTYTNPAARSGASAYGLKANASTTNTFGLRCTSSAPAGPGGYVGGVRTGWLPNKQYTISFYAKKLNGASFTNMGLEWNVSPAVVTVVSNPTLTTSYQRYVFVITWGAAVEANGDIFIDLATGTSVVANDEIHIDDLQVVQGGAAQTYVQQEQAFSYSNAGLVSFDEAPVASASLAWSGTYYWRCRFKQDLAEFNQFMYQFWELKKLEFTTVKA